MADIWFWSDPHLGHENIWRKFKNVDGSPLRPFSSTEEMNETLIENWNKNVKPHDKSYWLGDIAINVKKFLPLVNRFNGRKTLVAGNHDISNTKEYLKYFDNVRGCRVFVDEFVCSHIPLHPDSISDRFICNVHGHLHGNRVMWDYDTGMGSTWGPDIARGIDPRYFSVCVEQIAYMPIAFEDLKARIQKQMDDAGYVKPQSGWGNGTKPD